MKIWLSFLLILLSVNYSFAQIQAMVYLTQKNINNTHLALSQESIQRKAKFNIPLDSRDYAIESSKYQAISEFAPISKAVNWFNSVYVETDSISLEKITRLPFVVKVDVLSKNKNYYSLKSKQKLEYTEVQYGKSYNQIQLHQGQVLHDSGYTGKNIKIAVLDAGFYYLDSIYSFQKALNEHRIHPVWNVVYGSDSLFGYNSHGTQVMGCMASYVLDSCIGSSPDADYYLFITEDSRSETLAEETFWAIGAQMADSIGVDIINSSLGYTTFDDPNTNHQYQDMNGKTTIVSRAAQIACDKGIIVVNSAGNEGTNPWHFISAPADVPDVVSVGAVNSFGDFASFSGRGYTSDGSIKPTVMSVGSGTLLYYDKEKFHYGNGTSFASPLMAGLIACYWQANPTMSPRELRKKLITYSSIYTNPNPNYGFGIPDFQKMMMYNTLTDSSKYGQLKVYPNPIYNDLILEYRAYVTSLLDSAYIEVYNFNKLIYSSIQPIFQGYNQFFIDFSNSQKGMYFLRFKYKTTIIEKKLEKF